VLVVASVVAVNDGAMVVEEASVVGVVEGGDVLVSVVVKGSIVVGDPVVAEAGIEVGGVIGIELGTSVVWTPLGVAGGDGVVDACVGSAVSIGFGS